MHESEKREVHVLSIEDSAADRRLIRELLDLTAVAVTLHFAEDGAEALDYLYQRGKYAEAPCPDLILLDLNMPRRDGRQVLRDIKTAPGLKAIPVIVFTTSSSDADVQASYDLHANCYITKPTELEEFDAVLHKIEDYWLSAVQLPYLRKPGLSQNV